MRFAVFARCLAHLVAIGQVQALPTDPGPHVDTGPLSDMDEDLAGMRPLRDAGEPETSGDVQPLLDPHQPKSSDVDTAPARVELPSHVSSADVEGWQWDWDQHTELIYHGKTYHTRPRDYLPPKAPPPSRKKRKQPSGGFHYQVAKHIASNPIYMHPLEFIRANRKGLFYRKDAVENIAVGTIVLRRDETGNPQVLIHKRWDRMVEKEDGTIKPAWGGGKWEIAGGGVEMDDDSAVHAAARELWEEYGLLTSRFKMVWAKQARLSSRDHGRLRKYTFIVDVETLKPDPAHDEVMFLAWVDLKLFLQDLVIVEDRWVEKLEWTTDTQKDEIGALFEYLHFNKFTCTGPMCIGGE